MFIRAFVKTIATVITRGIPSESYVCIDSVLYILYCQKAVYKEKSYAKVVCLHSVSLAASRTQIAFQLRYFIYAGTLSSSDTTNTIRVRPWS